MTRARDSPGSVWFRVWPWSEQSSSLVGLLLFSTTSASEERRRRKGSKGGCMLHMIVQYKGKRVNINAAHPTSREFWKSTLAIFVIILMRQLGFTSLTAFLSFFLSTCLPLLLCLSYFYPCTYAGRHLKPTKALLGKIPIFA